MAGYEMPTRDDAIIQPPSLQEVQSIINHAAPHLQRALVLSYFAGLRPGAVELLRIVWNDVDLQGGTILVRSARKGGIQSRTVPLHPAAAKHLEQWKEEDKAKGLLKKDPAKGYSGEIVHYKGRSIEKLRSSWATAKKKAGIIRRLRLYDIRHAFVTALLEQGADLKTVSELVGHKDIDTTTKIYQHVTSELRRSTINQLPDLAIQYSQCQKKETKKNSE